MKRCSLSIISALLLAAIHSVLFIHRAEAQTIVFQNSNIIMGYISSGQTANISGYSNCFTSIGNSFSFRSDNSANIEPYFEVYQSGNSIVMNRHPQANGTGAFVCFANQFSATDIRSGTVGAGTTNIGAGLRCITSIGNFGKERVGSGEQTANISCNYNASTGNITTSVTNGGVISGCGYVCAVPNTTRVTRHVARSYLRVYSGTENIGTGLSCAIGNVVMGTICTGVGFHHGSYDPATGLVVRGQQDGCTSSSKSYFCIDPGKRACADGIDNDGDGLIDANDPGCWTNTSNPATYNPALEDEGRATAQCQDGVDNDGDGAIDLLDFSCSNRTDNDETNPKSACQDGIDNDGDGLTDLADPGCSSRQDNNEGDGTSQCQDGIDNDGDGAVDLADYSCSNRTDNDETNPKAACQDGIDNDGDGLTDLADPGCASRQDNNEGDGTSQCQDGIDNDGDGSTDFPSDFSCSTKQDNDEANPKAACQDGVDNDSDGLTDLADPGCATVQDNNEGNGTSQCQDGIDNDGDGATDFPADYSCSTKTDNDEANPKSQCQDGIDNDTDGLTDSNDPGCATNQDNNEGDKTSACQDGIDNDNDGAVDFPADFSCSSKTDNDEGNPKSGCQDGIDNDSDGLVDLNDPGCSSGQDNNEGDGTSQCQDKIDNDNDGLVDLADPGCSTPTDNNEGDGTSACQDKIDNDGDGLVDLADPGCNNPQDGNEVDEISRLQIIGECVYDNLDGTLTAYFGYENNFGVETSVVTDSSKSTVNSFTPVLPAGGQTTTFKVGRHKGVLAVVFNGDPLVWTVQVAQGVTSTATLSRASQFCQQVQPVAECIDSNASGLLGTFGYVNQNEFPIRIAVGSKNGFAPTPLDRGQPTTFNAGTNKGVFVTPFSDQLTWTLGSRTTTITPSTAVCQGGCVGTATTSIKSNLDEAALKLATFAKQAANFLNSQAKKQLSSTEAASVSKDVVRAKKRADAFFKEANALTLKFPAVVKNCPNAAQVCKTEDNGGTIERLRGLYQQLVKMSTRSVARGNFRVSGNTAANKSSAIVAGAKAAQQSGLAALAELPRFSTECK